MQSVLLIKTQVIALVEEFPLEFLTYFYLSLWMVTKIGASKVWKQAEMNCHLWPFRVSHWHSWLCKLSLIWQNKA